MLFLVSCTEILPPEIRSRFARVFVIHESPLPQGRGWSPLAWQIIEGKNDIIITLLEAVDRVDAGPIVAQAQVHLGGHELADEIHAEVVRAKCQLMQTADLGKRVMQSGEPSYYRRRTPEDSRLDPNKTIAEQFNLLRICEPRFPAFFEHRGHTYEITITKRESGGECSASK